MTPIEKAMNLGPKMAHEFAMCGINSLEELEEFGVEESFLILTEKFPERINLNCLCAIYGSIHRVDWRSIPSLEKEKLKSFLAKTKKLHEKSIL
jgi:hypothetical protein